MRLTSLSQMYKLGDCRYENFLARKKNVKKFRWAVDKEFCLSIIESSPRSLDGENETEFLMFEN